jgi:hypothetical protein
MIHYNAIACIILLNIVAGLLAEVEGRNVSRPCNNEEECGKAGCECKLNLCVCPLEKPEFVETTFTSHSECQKEIPLHK